MDTVLIVPGLGNSGASHWQSWMESRLCNGRRVHQSDWETADLDRWAEPIVAAADAARGRVWIVAHSFGCLAAARAAKRTRARIAGALLVAPADPATFGIASALLDGALPCETIVVGSENDAWMSLPAARRWSLALGAAFVNAGQAGHINVASGHGPWPAGLRLLDALRDARPAARRPANPRAGISIAEFLL